MTFEEYKKELSKLIKHKDREAPHERCDELICAIAIDASFGYLSTAETGHLVDLYNQNTKWYA